MTTLVLCLLAGMAGAILTLTVQRRPWSRSKVDCSQTLDISRGNYRVAPYAGVPVTRSFDLEMPNEDIRR